MVSTELFRSHFIPSVRPSKKLMIVMHGRGDDIGPFKKFNEELGLLDLNYLLLRAPKKFLDGYSWYGEPPYLEKGVQKIRVRLFQLLEELESQGWRAEDILLFGFSQGCLVSTDFALNYPKKLGGVIGISGYFHFFPHWKKRISKSARNTPWLLTHGYQDDILSLEETRFGVEKIKSAGIRIDWKELDKDHSLIEEEYPLIRRWVRDKLGSI